MLGRIPIYCGRFTPLYMRQELIVVHVTLLPSLSVQALSSSEINFVSVSNAVVASITATGRDLKKKQKVFVEIKTDRIPTNRSGLT